MYFFRLEPKTKPPNQVKVVQIPDTLGRKICKIVSNALNGLLMYDGYERELEMGLAVFQVFER